MPSTGRRLATLSCAHGTGQPSGIDLAHQLDASLISFEGTQHTVVFKGDHCVDTAVVNYFVNLTRPGDLHC